MAYLGEDIRKLGFGMMRLPRNGDEIDIEQTKEMVDRFLAAGFTYFDTAWAYAGSEDAVRQALVERYPRDRYQLATKNAAWLNCNTKEEAQAQLETSLRQTGAGYFDFYLLHNLGDVRTAYFDKYDMWNWAQQKKREGLLRHVGFSIHGTPEELETILTEHPEMEFVQLQINYADWEDPSVCSRRCYEIARKHNKPVIIMEPVKGGMLATPPQTVVDVLQAAEPGSSPASWAIRFAAGLDGVITVLSGMSNLEQVEDNISCMKAFRGLTDAQRETLGQAQAELSRMPLIPCTECNYCAKVCPMEIGISGMFKARNLLTLYGSKETAVQQLTWLVDEPGKKRADQCIQCGKCEEACPQHIAIREELQEVCHVLLE